MAGKDYRTHGENLSSRNIKILTYVKLFATEVLIIKAVLAMDYSRDNGANTFEFYPQTVGVRVTWITHMQ